MTNELLNKVDWNEWKKNGGTITSPKAMPQAEIPEHERVALLVLALGRFVGKKKETKIVRMALREIEQSVLSAEQDIDYL